MLFNVSQVSMVVALFVSVGCRGRVPPGVSENEGLPIEGEGEAVSGEGEGEDARGGDDVASIFSVQSPTGSIALGTFNGRLGVLESGVRVVVAPLGPDSTIRGAGFRPALPRDVDIVVVSIAASGALVGFDVIDDGVSLPVDDSLVDADVSADGHICVLSSADRVDERRTQLVLNIVDLVDGVWIPRRFDLDGAAAPAFVVVDGAGGCYVNATVPALNAARTSRFDRDGNEMWAGHTTPLASAGPLLATVAGLVTMSRNVAAGEATVTDAYGNSQRDGGDSPALAIVEFDQSGRLIQYQYSDLLDIIPSAMADDGAEYVIGGGCRDQGARRGCVAHIDRGLVRRDMVEVDSGASGEVTAVVRAGDRVVIAGKAAGGVRQGLVASERTIGHAAVSADVSESRLTGLKWMPSTVASTVVDADADSGVPVYLVAVSGTAVSANGSALTSAGVQLLVVTEPTLFDVLEPAPEGPPVDAPSVIEIEILPFSIFGRQWEAIDVVRSDDGFSVFSRMTGDTQLRQGDGSVFRMGGDKPLLGIASIDDGGGLVRVEGVDGVAADAFFDARVASDGTRCVLDQHDDAHRLVRDVGQTRNVDALPASSNFFHPVVGVGRRGRCFAGVNSGEGARQIRAFGPAGETTLFTSRGVLEFAGETDEKIVMLASADFGDSEVSIDTESFALHQGQSLFAVASDEPRIVRELGPLTVADVAVVDDGVVLVGATSGYTLEDGRHVPSGALAMELSLDGSVRWFRPLGAANCLLVASDGQDVAIAGNAVEDVDAAPGVTVPGSVHARSRCRLGGTAFALVLNRGGQLKRAGWAQGIEAVGVAAGNGRAMITAWALGGRVEFANQELDLLHGTGLALDVGNLPGVVVGDVE
jgi:hypothetical protein